jgi:hypothetical protein
VLAVQANPVKALLVVTTQTVVVRLPNAQPKVVAVPLAAAVVSAVATVLAIKVTAVAMTSNPATFVTMPAVMWPVLAQTTKKIITNVAATQAVSLTHCAPAWTVWPAVAVVVAVVASVVTVVVIVLAAVVSHHVAQAETHRVHLDVNPAR